MFDDTGKNLLVCHHCPEADLSQTTALCRADEKRRYIGDLAHEGTCPLNRFPKQGGAKIVHGVAGLAKAAFGVDRTPDSVIARRLNVCKACPHANLHSSGEVSTCQICGCQLKAKIRIAHENCPVNRWTKTGPKVAVVQVGRYGDILGVLPLMRKLAMDGQSVMHVVCPDFLPLVEGLSYLIPHAHPGGKDEASRAARDIADEVIATQPSGNELKEVAPSLVKELWLRAGVADQWDEIPLVLDNRDAERERELCRNLIGTDPRPILLVNTTGISSRYAHGPELMQWVRDRWGEQCNVIDIGPIRARRFQDICGLFERSTALISIDTATLHLARATGTPTVGLVNDNPYSASPRREHWIERLTYGESLTDAGKERIAAAIDAQLAKPRPLPHILHLVDDSWRPATDKDDYRRLAATAETWVGLEGWTTVRFRAPKRTSKDLAPPDERAMPFIKEMFDWACSLALPGDIICFTNADIGLVPEAPDVIRRALARWPCAYGHRVELEESQPQIAEHLSTRKQYDGVDVFAFTPQWWASVRDECPDVLEGYSNWDAVLMLLMQRKAGNCVLPQIAWHKRHHSYWLQHQHCPGERHNAALARQWAQSLPGGCERLAPPNPDRTFWPIQIERSKIRVCDVDCAVFAPWFGEFGVMLLFWAPLVWHYPAKRKIVCCRRGEEAYFPGCEFDYDWQDGIPDANRVGSMRNEQRRYPFVEQNRERVSARYPGSTWVDVTPNNCWDYVRPCRVPMKPQKLRGLPKVDIAVGARWRQAFSEKNWKHWPKLLGELKSRGLTLAAVGKRDTSFDFPDFDLRAWECGDNAGANLEILHNCRLYLGTDTGTTHLAMHAGAKMVLFRHPTPDLTCWNPMREIAGNRLTFVAEGWEEPGMVLDAVTRAFTHCMRITKT